MPLPRFPMKPKTRNEYLETSESEADLGGHDSGAEELAKGRKNLKRRRTPEVVGSSDASDSSDDEDADGVALEKNQEAAPAGNGPDAATAVVSPPGDSATLPGPSDRGKQRKVSLKPPASTRPLHKNLVSTDAAVVKSGVLYLSRIPPFMKPAKLRSLLSPHGQLNRIFLAPEDPASHARRVRAGGNKKRTFVEGWVEFVRKRDAKLAAELLNTRPVGGKKGSYYRDDVWSVLYLRGFKWRDLTAQIATEEQERAARMRAEMRRAARADREFARNVEQSRAVSGMERKRQAKQRGEAEGGGGREETAGVGGEGQEDMGRLGRRAFKQVQAVAKRRKVEDEPAEAVTRVLSKIF